MKRLKAILETRRSHGSLGEAAFVSEFLTPYKPTAMLGINDANVFAYAIDVADEQSVVPPVLWCCHIDSCAHSDEFGLTQDIVFDEDIDMAFCVDGAKECLGADDGGGIWLLLEMIDAKVPGTYLFHRGEECGGIGSRGMTEDHEEWLKRFRWAIAFDRGDICSVITEQMGGECASSGFALAFAAALLPHSEYVVLAPDDTGSFTDTANYTHLIPECSNISIGYQNQHGPDEMLDLWYLRELRGAVIAAFKDGIDLPVVRTPEARSFQCFRGFGDSSRRYSFEQDYKSTWTSPYRGLSLVPDLKPEGAYDIVKMDWTELVDYVCSSDADEVANLLLDLAEEVRELRDERRESRGDWRELQDAQPQADSDDYCGYDSDGAPVSNDAWDNATRPDRVTQLSYRLQTPVYSEDLDEIPF